jgi:hypothetical protein
MEQVALVLVVLELTLAVYIQEDLPAQEDLVLGVL